MASLPFTQWQNVELRVGKILSVDDHPRADKLYVLRVDLGKEQRTIVAGIKQHYAKEDLLHKYVVVVANLEPAVLRGVTSEGMLLAAVEDGEQKVAFISPEREVRAGSLVR